MSTVILVRLEIQIPDLSCTRWLPMGKNLVIPTEHDNVTVRLWFDSGCIGHIAPLDFAEIDNYINPSLNKAKMDVAIQGASNDLSRFIYDYSDWPQRGTEIIPSDEYHTKISQEYTKLGQCVLKAAVDSYNRLVSYFRVYKGQYWLKQRHLNFNVMHSNFVEFRAKVRIGDKPWTRWCPPSQSMLTLINIEEFRLFAKEECPQFEVDPMIKTARGLN